MTPGKAVRRAPHSRRLSFGPGEWSGAFGDVGTDWPLLAGMVAAAGMVPARVLVLFGVCQVLAGWFHRMPMPVQPLKVIAAIVIARGMPASVVAGAGLSVAFVMLALTLAGALERLDRLVPPAVIRGVQFGLGLKLCLLAFSRYIASAGAAGWVLAAACGVVLVAAVRVRMPVPRTLVVLVLGAVVGLSMEWPTASALAAAAQPAAWTLPNAADLSAGLLLLALPQLPLSIGNAVLATRDLAESWFPGRGVTVRRLGLSYALLNLLSAPLGGVPVCHGAGGMAGHVVFGARTGGSVIVYGGFFVAAGLIAVPGADVFAWFPLPVLGVILLFEGGALLRRLQGLRRDGRSLALAAAVGLTAAFAPYGFLVATIAGTVVAHLFRCGAGPARGKPRVRPSPQDVVE